MSDTHGTEDDPDRRPRRPAARHFIEFSVIFLGVWLGLLAENYREFRQERDDERISLERLARDLDDDHEDMTGNLWRAEIGYEATTWLLEHADREHIDPDSLAYHLHRLWYASTLVPNTSEYTALKNSGRINIIRDVDLRQKLTELYERTYVILDMLHDREVEHTFSALHQISPDVRFGVDEEGYFPPVSVVGNPADIVSEPYFLHRLSVLGQTRLLLINEYGRLIPQVEELRNQALAQSR